MWRVIVSDREDGCVSDMTPLADFAIEHQWASFGESSQMNYGVNVYDDGAVVSIVCDVSSHGTHVAGITGC